MVTAMRGGGPIIEAMRVLHCCYCCDDADAAVRFLEQGIGLDARVHSRKIRTDGSPLGIPRTVESDVCLVYDGRGPRVSPAIEVHGWIDPPATGQPYDVAWQVGIQAIGVGVPSLADALAGLTRLGAVVVGSTPSDLLSFGGTSAIVRAPDGVCFDVLERPALDGTRFAHLRVTCTGLERSVEWYTALGWSVIGDGHEVRVPGDVFATGADAVVSYARLRLPDEPFGLLLVQWHEPRSRVGSGAPYDAANHRGLYRLALGVEDTRAATRRLVASGWTPTSEPSLIELPGTKVPDMWITFLADPDGIVVQLVERERAAFADFKEA